MDNLLKFLYVKNTSLVLLRKFLCCVNYKLSLIDFFIQYSQASAPQKKDATMRQDPVRVGVEHVQ